MILLALLSCVDDPASRPFVDCDDAAVVATTDYAVGALATVCPDLTVNDALAPTSGDPMLVATEDRLVVLERSGGDRLRVFTDDLSAPDLELALDPGANPHGAAVSGDLLFVSQYATDEIAVVDLGDGAVIGAVDLSAVADDDGIPEADALVAWGDHLYVPLQRIDRETWTSTGGLVAEIDPDGLRVARTWETGPNPKLFADDGGLMLLTGNHFVADGAMQRLVPDAGLSDPLFTEAELGLDLVDYAGGDGRGMLVASDPDAQDYTLLCLSGDAVVGEATTPSLVADVALDGEGRAFVAARTNYGNAAPSSGGLEVRALDDCALVDTVSTALEPYAVVFP